MNAGSTDQAVTRGSDPKSPATESAVEPIIVLLGSNIAPRRNLEDAVAHLSTWFAVTAVSRIYASKAVGSDGPDFLNAAVTIATLLEPCVLHFDALRAIEAQLGRRRGTDPNAPRTIDLDLVVYGEDPIDIACVVDDVDCRLRLPDRDIGRLAHITLPLVDVAPWLRVGGPTSRTLAEVAAFMVGFDVAPVGEFQLD